MSTSCLVAGAGLCLLVGAGFAGTSLAGDRGEPDTASPIEHLVIIFQENVSFDHYFATYPVALNPTGEPFFRASDDTPAPTRLTLSASPARRRRPVTRTTTTGTSRKLSTKG